MSRWLCILSLFCVSLLEGAPQWGSLEDKLDTVRHLVSNHDQELHVLEEKINSQEAIIDSLRDQVRQSSKSNLDVMKDNVVTFESRLLGLESANKSLVADIKTLRSHANDTGDILTALKKQLSDIEKLMDHQNQNAEHLQSALSLVMEALSIKEPAKQIAAKDAVPGIYVVQSGDSLEKIARKYKTSIKTLKDLNNLAKDTIAIGQKLKVPDKS